MKGRVLRNERAKRDIIEQFVYLGEIDRSLALRFKKAVDEASFLLAANPELGAPVDEPPGKEYARLRKWVLKEFSSILIFYRPIPTGIRIIRVIHSSVDYRRVLQSDN